MRRQIPGKHQIDAMAWDDDDGFLVTVECTGKRTLGRKSLKSRISEISDELRDIRRWWQRQNGPKAIAKMVLATRNIKISDTLRDRAEQKGIYVWDDDVLDHYGKLSRALADWTRYEMKWSMGVRQEYGPDPIKVDGALEIKQKGTKVYVFSISPEKLLRVAFVHRRDPLEPSGYQRIVQPRRLEELRKYLTEVHGLLPNNIIVNFPPKTGFRAYTGFPTSGARLGFLTIPNSPCSAWVIDGQHRLMAFAGRRMRRLAKKFHLCVVGFRGLQRKTQAKLFMKINETQKKVSASLRADLASELYPNEPRGAAALIVKELAAARPFKGLVSSRLWERRRIKLANFTDSLLKSRMVDRSARRVPRSERRKVVRLVRRFFMKVDQQVGDEDIKGFLLGNNGVAVLLRILNRAVFCSGGRLAARQLRQTVNETVRYPWKRALKKGVYSSEGDRQRLADLLMNRIAKRHRWFSPPPKRARKPRG